MNELDIQYSPSYWCKRGLTPEEVVAHHFSFIKNASRQAVIPHQLNIPYGPTPRQQFDIFGTDLPDDAPILVYIHGGYWQFHQLHRSSYHFIAKNLYKNKIKTIFLGYDLCPDVTFEEIVSQVETGAQKCIEYANSLKSRGIYFVGHSAGAYLVSILFNSPFSTAIKGAILVSGIYDLVPLQKTVINEPLNLDEIEAKRLSSMYQSIPYGTRTKFLCVLGGNESPEFLKQSSDFNDKLTQLNYNSQYLVIDNIDHYDIIQLLAKENFELVKRIVEFINRT